MTRSRKSLSMVVLLPPGIGKAARRAILAPSPLRRKRLPAKSTGMIVSRLFDSILRMGIPPGNPTGRITELALPLMRCLMDGRSTLLAMTCSIIQRMPSAPALHGIHRQAKCVCDRLIPFPLALKDRDFFYFFIGHSIDLLQLTDKKGRFVGGEMPI